MKRHRSSGMALKSPLRRAFQMQVRRYWWRMDIDPAATIAASAYIDRTWPKGIHIGPNAVIDEEAVILSHDMTRGVYLDTSIGAGCYIGPRAVILPGLTIGDGAIVRAGAVVTKDVAAGCEAEGNPARIV
jgi:acetyltransferase-like isoleucine patch superfamily enzyme